MNYNLKNKFITFIFFTLGLGIGIFGVKFATEREVINPTINKLEKEVTIDEKGIADSVEKLYDAVVVVESINNNKLVSSGTGFVFKKEDNHSYIMTNAHVLSKNNNIQITFSNNEIEKAEVIGSDIYSDIAILKVTNKNITKVASTKESKTSRLGDTVFAIGAPIHMDYSWTVTRGTLSGKDRLVEVEMELGNAVVMSVMQTDTAINSGNSGGPLANVNGEVIGVTNMKLMINGVEGMGFAIPIEDAMLVADELIKNGKIDRPVLGVGTLDAVAKEALKAQYNIEIANNIREGAVVVMIEKDYPAAKSTLKKGDVIIKLGENKIDSSSRLKYYLYKHKINDEIEITYIRGNKEHTTKIKLDKKS